MSNMKACLLVVEDYEDTLNAIVRLLKVNGYRVAGARGFKEARTLAAFGECDALISDVEDRGGSDPIRDPKSRYGPRTIALCGQALGEDVSQARRAGLDKGVGKLDKLFVKPFDPDRLLKAVAQLSPATRAVLM
jgi:CheY-like chemotaxis protein